MTKIMKFIGQQTTEDEMEDEKNVTEQLQILFVLLSTGYTNCITPGRHRWALYQYPIRVP